MVAANGALQQWVVAKVEPSGQFTAQVVGVPELRATAASRAEAIKQVRVMVADWLARGQLMSIEVPCPNPLLQFSGHLDPTDPLEQEFVEELARQRQIDVQETLREDAQECLNSSSTPTT